MMKIKIILLIVLFTAGCVKIELKPEKIVSDTVSATKEAYSAVKRKHDGTQKRIFTHKVALSNNLPEQEAAKNCLIYLRQMAGNATEDAPVILSEATEIVEQDDKKFMLCSLTAEI